MNIEEFQTGDRVEFSSPPDVRRGLFTTTAPSARGRLMCFISGAPHVRFELGDGKTELLEVVEGQVAVLSDAK